MRHCFCPREEEIIDQARDWTTSFTTSQEDLSESLGAFTSSFGKEVIQIHSGFKPLIVVAIRIGGKLQAVGGLEASRNYSAFTVHADEKGDLHAHLDETLGQL